MTGDKGDAIRDKTPMVGIGFMGIGNLNPFLNPLFNPMLFTAQMLQMHYESVKMARKFMGK